LRFFVFIANVSVSISFERLHFRFYNIFVFKITIISVSVSVNVGSIISVFVIVSVTEISLVRIGNFGDFFRPINHKIRSMLLLIRNRKSHTRLRLVPKSTTLDDPELTLNGYYAL